MGVLDEMLEGVPEPAPPEKSTWEKFKTGVSNIPSDVGTSLGDYATGAVQGYNELQRAQDQAFGNSIGATSEENTANMEYLNEAQEAFADETIKPPLLPAALAGNTVAGILYAPFMAKDAYTSYEEGGGGIEGAKTVVRDFTYGGAVDFYNQPDLAQKFEDRPVQNTVNGILSVAPAFLLGRSAYKAGKKVINKSTIAQEMGVEPTILTDVAGEQVAPTSAEIMAKDIPAPKATIEEAPAIRGNDIISSGEKQLGKPYELGADGTNATDCGLFTQQTLAENGINLDYRTADGQFLQMEREGKTFTSESEAQVGDLVFFDVPSNRSRWSASDDPAAVNNSGEAYKGVTHVGIYAGEGKVLQAGSHGVSYADINAFGDIVGFAKTGEGEGVRAVTSKAGELTSEESLSKAAKYADEGNYAEAYNEAVKAGDTEWIDKYKTIYEENKSTIKEAYETIDWESLQKENNTKIVEDYLKAGNEVTPEIKTRYPEIAEQYKDTSKITIDPNEQGSFGNSTTTPAESTYTKPVTRAEIVNDINKLVVSRTGKIGNSAFEGVHKVDKAVIRTRNYGDFDTSAHEIGHYIDKQLGVKGHYNELIRAANKEWGNNPIYEKYSPVQRRAEGIAEFGRQYLLNPKQAEKNFPGYYKDFTAALAKNDKIAKPLNSIGEKMRAWYAQSAEARGRGGVSFGNEDFTSFKSKAKDAAFKAYEAFFDDKVGLSRLTGEIEKQIGKELEFEENPYKRARMVQNSALARAEMLVTDSNPALVQEVLNKLYNNKIKYAVTMKDIFDGLDAKKLNAKYPEYLKNGNFKNWHEAFSTLLSVKRQIELQDINPEYKGPTSKADAAKIVKDAPKELQDLTEKFYQYNDNLLSIAEDGGLISKETVDALREKYKNYAPMARDFADEGALENGYSTGSKLGNLGNPLKRLTEEGSTRSVIDPIENVLKNTYTLLSAVERNKVAQTFIKLNDKTGIGRFVEKVPGETADANKSIFTVMENGKKQAFQTTPEFYSSIMSMNQATSNMLVSVFKPFAKVLRIGATISPDFIVRNLIRDTLTAGIYSETGFKPILDSAKGVFSLVKDKQLAYEFKASGAPLSAFVGLDRANANKILTKMAGDNNWSKANPLHIAESIYEGMRKASEAAESGTRIREFERARQQGKSIEEAGLFAKDITLDFSRSGTLTRQINQAIPFFNAVLQGGDRLTRSFKDNPVRTSKFVFTYITLPSIGLWIMNHDQDWYKELSDDIKNGSWVFNNNGTIIRVPKPFEPGILFGSSIERALDQAYTEDKHAVKQWVKYAAQGFMPSLMPTLFGPIIEWVTNYNMFTGKPVVGRKEQGLPDELQYNAYTSELAKKIGFATGTSPEKIDNTISGYTASAGKFAVGLLDGIIGNKKELPEKKPSELPGIRGLTYTPLKNPKSVEDFYENFEKMEKDYNANGKKGNPPADVRAMRAYAKQISDLNKLNRQITSSDKLTPEQKRQKIDANNAKELDIARKANAKYLP